MGVHTFTYGSAQSTHVATHALVSLDEVLATDTQLYVVGVGEVSADEAQFFDTRATPFVGTLDPKSGVVTSLAITPVGGGLYGGRTVEHFAVDDAYVYYATYGGSSLGNVFRVPHS